VTGVQTCALPIYHPQSSIANVRKPVTEIISSRGCPFNCIFCSIHTVWGRKWRARSSGNVVDEIEMLVKDIIKLP
jgi:radical SAM superfamily enzyme YgiQ (UPF0313 family)